jgi:hypothetical protein
MADGRKNNGGHKTAGRKPKSEEIELIEALDKHIDKDEVFIVLKKLASEGDMKAVTLYMNYRFGKPKETKDIKVELDNDFPSWLDE